MAENEQMKKMSSEITKDHRYHFHTSCNNRSYEFLGVHRIDFSGETGYIFRTWAPRAKAVSLIGDFNDWNENSHSMQQMFDDDSIWEVFIPDSDGIKEEQLYKFVITTDKDEKLYKADPYAFESESGRLEDGSMRASRIFDINKEYRWNDASWLKKRSSWNPYQSPMNIYEVHVGSWKHKEDGKSYSYAELADELIKYVKDMGYTHIEILPIMEHPFDGSWGYQITGYYSVTSRYGRPDEFRALIDAAHRADIGVIIDWVPAHFPKDEHGLIEYDGYPLYEDSDPLRMEHKGWGTRAFDYGRPEVLSFLVSNALFYCDKFHVDGLRVDAVAAMIYLNYDREDGEWMPNSDGTVENKEAVKFLQTVNQDLLTAYSGVLMIAEESTAWPNVTKPPKMGGLGFNFKWNMGWMNDVLEYFQTDPMFRSGIHNKLTFSISYAYSENFILPISHDEVVHGKKSLLDKMPGEYEDKFAGLRSFFVYMYAHPGKKLTFMGQEIGQFIEWDEKRELDWMLLDYDKHREMQRFVSDLNKVYIDNPALWKADTVYDGFEWIDADNSADNVYTFYRTDAMGEDTKKKEVILVCLNLSGVDIPEYDIGVPKAESYEVLIDSDNLCYGGCGRIVKDSSDKGRNASSGKYKVIKGACNGYDQHIKVRLPKMSGIMFKMR